MAFPDTVFLKDRIKEISRSNGVGNFSLDGAAAGFSSFSSAYSNGDAVFYAITDGTSYEVGSGQFFNDGGSNQSISRFAFRSSYSNNNVPFDPGVKEVFVTYPGEFALFSAGGMGSFTEPDVSGIAFFGSKQTVDYSSSLIFDKNNSRIGISQSSPEYSIDIGGTPRDSLMRVSGVIVAESGIIFSGVSPTHTSSYSGGIQLEPFMRNELDATTGSNAIFSLSGLVDQRLLLSKQIKGSVFAGPASGCVSAGCSPDYPTFRYLAWQDIPDLSHLYTKQFVDSVGNVPYQGDVTFYKESGILDHDHFFKWDATNNRLGINRSTPTFTLDVDGDGSISGAFDVQKATQLHDDLYVSGNVTVSGNLDVQGNVTYIDSSIVTIWDKQIEVASMSGFPQYGDALLDDAGIVIKSTDTDKKWTWKDSNDSWRTDEGIGASGILQVSGVASFGDTITATGNIRSHSNIIASGLNMNGDDPDNYINGSVFFRKTTDDPFTLRITEGGINAYTRGSAYAGFVGREFNQVAGNVVNACSGLNTAQAFIYSTYGVHAGGDVNYQRLAISGSRHGNFEITTQAQGSGLVRGIDFKSPTNFTSDAPVVMSGTLGVSGQTILNGGLTTYSGGPGVFDPNIVINSSGLLAVPIFNGTAASLATTLPPTTWTSGAIVFINDPANPKALAVNNGYTWYSGVLS